MVRNRFGCGKGEGMGDNNKGNNNKDKGSKIDANMMSRVDEDM